MEHGDPFNNGYFEFFSSIGLGSTQASSTDLPPSDGGNFSLTTAWSGFGSTGYLGGFGRSYPFEIANNLTNFSMWINPDAGQDFRLEINLQEDDNGDGSADEEFQFNCDISPVGPCAVAGGGWQLVSIPLSSFFDDNSFLTGGNGILDAVPVSGGGNGQLTSLVMAIITNTAADPTFRTDYWAFLADADSDGIDDGIDNCTNVANPGQEDVDSDGHGNICDADFDNSCLVNSFDLGIFKSAFFTNDPEIDLDSSGLVNSFDLGIFKAMFFQPPGPSAPGALCP